MTPSREICHIKGLFTRREGYPCARVTLASGSKLARVGFKVWVRPYPPGPLYHVYWPVPSSCVTGYEIKLEFLYGYKLNSRKNGKILSSYTENTFYCSYVYNLAQQLDDSVQIVKITGQVWRRKVVPGRRVVLSKAFARQVAIGYPLVRVTLPSL